MEKKDNSPEVSESSALKWADRFNLYWPKIRDALIKFALLRFLPKVIAGPWGWLVTTLLTWSVDHVLKPMYDFTERKIIILIRKQRNNQRGRDVQNSKTEDEFDSSVDNLP